MSSPSKRTCPDCHEETVGFSIKCWNCGSYLEGPPQAAGTLARILVPVGRSRNALAAGYLALLAIVPLYGLPFAVCAIACGMAGLKEIANDPRLLGRVRAWFGIIVGAVMITLTGAVTILYLLPNWR